MDLNQRSKDIFYHIVEAFVGTGAPIGSTTLSKSLGLKLSSATIRNIMADLEHAGLLYAPHTSAGRLPTEKGLQFFVHGLLEAGQVSRQEREKLEQQFRQSNRSFDDILEQATTALSGLSSCAGLVLAPKVETPLKHIEFVGLNDQRVLVVLVTEAGTVENRVLELDQPVPSSVLTEASNYLNSLVAGRTLPELKRVLTDELTKHQSQLDEVSGRLISSGLAEWTGDQERTMIVRGQSHLIQGVEHGQDITSLRDVFTALDQKESVASLLDQVIDADGVQVFVGSENPLFPSSGCSTIIAPYKDAHNKIIGAIGVVGPQRMNYSRVIPLVDYTAKMIGQLIK